MIYVHNLLCRRVARFLYGLDPSFNREGDTFFFSFIPDDQSIFSQLQCALVVEDNNIRLAMDYPIKPCFADEKKYWQFTQFFDFLPPYVEYGRFIFCEETHRIQYQLLCDCSRCPPSGAALLDCIGLGVESLNKWNTHIQALLAEVPADVLEENLSQEQPQQPDNSGMAIDALDYEDALGLLRPVSRFRFQLVARRDALLAQHRLLSSAVHGWGAAFVLCGFLAAVAFSGAMAAEQLLELVLTYWKLPITVPDSLIRLSCMPRKPLGLGFLAWGILGIFFTVRALANKWKRLCDGDEAPAEADCLVTKALMHTVKLCFFLFCGTAALSFAVILPYDPVPAALNAIFQFGALFLLCMLTLSTSFRESPGTPWRWAFVGLLHFAAAVGGVFLPAFL